MKIFSWLHRQLNPTVNYSHISHNKDVFNGVVEEKEESVRENAAERGTQALLLHDVLLNGILTIGTLGHQLEEEFLVEAEKEKEKEKEKVEEVEVVIKEGEVRGATMFVVASKATLESLKKKPAALVVREERCEDAAVQVDAVKDEYCEEDLIEIQEKPLLKEYDERMISGRGRTTLADLFAAEAFVAKEERKESGEKAGGGGPVSKVVRCMEKEQIKKGEKSAPGSSTARKLNRLMRRMVRKKIHPEQINGPCNTDKPLMRMMMAPPIDTCQSVWRKA